MLRSPITYTRIDVARDCDVQYWAERWGVPAFEIRRAVDRAGPLLADVERSLTSRRPTISARVDGQRMGRRSDGTD
jgi:hypothetical protein